MKRLFYQSRLQLAFWYSLVMAGILGVSGILIYRSILFWNWTALEREIQSIAGTLHDSLEPMLPITEDPAHTLTQIFPDLCLVNQPCNPDKTTIQRHTTGISDRNIYYLRLFNVQGKLLAFSDNQPSLMARLPNQTPWQTFTTPTGKRYLQFTTILHATNQTQSSWGYLQIGRDLKDFDAEAERIQWILMIGFPISLGVVIVSAWFLSYLAMKPIYQSYQQQQLFTDNVAHELRSPLASLLATVEAIMRDSGTFSEEGTALLQTVEKQGRRLSKLITDLLLLTSLEQKTLLDTFEHCSLNDLVNDLTEEFLELAIAAEIHLSSNVISKEIYVWGNESQLYRLVSNLIANAIQYTPAEGSIHITLTSDEQIAIIAVQDTGIGVPLDQQERIFERFYRVNRDRSRKTGGTGLGLAIAQAIATKHQGSLTVQSELNQGSLFTVQLPLAPAPIAQS
jgi:two-component system, OmpR family, Ni(II)-sensor and/or redox sensor kinase NrsS